MRALLASALLVALATPLPASSSDPVVAPWPGFHDERRSGWSDYFALPDFDLPVYAVAVHDGRLVLGGVFRHVGPQPVSALATWDGRAFEAHGLTGTVTGIAEDGSDLILGGRFRWDAAGPDHAVARWDGSEFRALGELGGGLVTDVVVWNGVVVASGNLSVGEARGPHAYFDGTEWHAMPSPGPSEHTLRVHQGELFAVRNAEAKRWVHPHGWEIAFTADGPIAEILSRGDEMLVAGGFTTIEGVPAERLARFDGKEWSEFGGGVQGYSYDIVRTLRDLGEGRLFVGGNFRSVGGMDSYNAALWNGVSWEPIGQGTVMYFRDAVGYRGEVVASGTLFTSSADGDAMRVARYDGHEWQALSHQGQGIGNPWNNGALVEVLLAHERELYAAGSFSRAGGLRAASIARFDGTEWHPLADGLRSSVYTLAVHRGRIVAGGRITGSELRNVALWSGSAWEPLGAGLSGYVRNLASYGGDLFASGDPAYFSRWDGSAWSVVGGELDGPVHALFEHRGRLIAGGEFSRIGGETIANLASWDGTRFEAVGGGTDGAVRDVTEYRGELVVGGDFERVGGREIPRLARWNGSSWRGFDESLISAWTIDGSRPIEYRTSVRELEAIGAHLYVAGDPLIGTESVPTNGIIRWGEDDRRWSELDGGVPGAPSCFNPARTIEAFGGAVLVGGSFRTLGRSGVPSRNVAAWRPPRGGTGPVFVDSPTGASATVGVGRFLVSPSPFRSATTMRLTLSSPTRARLTIHDVQGRLVRELRNGPQPAGEHAFRWDGLSRDGRSVPAGVYFVRLESERGTVTRKVLRLR